MDAARYGAPLHPGSAADRRPLDVDLVDAGSGLPGQVRERSGGRAVDHAPVEGKLRPVARAHEMLLAVIECVRASEVWAGDRERSQLPAIASQTTRERRIAGRVVLTSVRYDKRGTGRRVEARSRGLAQCGERSIQRDADFLLDLFRVARRKQVYGYGRESGDHCGRQQRAESQAA